MEPPISVLARLFPDSLKVKRLWRILWRNKNNGTRRPPLLGIDVRRRNAVALDRAAPHCGLCFAGALFQKIRIYRCYNLIYKTA